MARLHKLAEEIEGSKSKYCSIKSKHQRDK
ncbi:hypothetical protein CCACVL1_22866 [Corchorus capsularis]|uniref:Uncharacterized protein n=1 Tax=Corchorus capsularis TaxID=210143 RepID=A0A1R3GW74_COCAP|nr:hypothetical protein CCACVL1_22866 [Corchorus capsularis]